MTQYEIIEMAIQTELNLYVHDLTEKQYIEVIKDFAQLVAAEEREACAKLCDARAIEYDGFTEEQNASEKLATAIRARGEA
jgi:hypothetical protein